MWIGPLGWIPLSECLYSTLETDAISAYHCTTCNERGATEAAQVYGNLEITDTTVSNRRYIITTQQHN